MRSQRSPWKGAGCCGWQRVTGAVAFFSYCDRLSNLHIHAAYEVFPVRGEERRQCSPLITLPPAGYVPKTRRHTGGSCHTQSCYLPSIFSAFMIVSVGFISTAAVMTMGSTWLINAASLLSSHQKENTHGESFPLALRVAFFFSLTYEK